MGQGTESCGGYDIEYDPAEEGLEDGTWISGHNVSDMNVGHLRNAIRHAQIRANTSNFSHDEDTWNYWVEILEDELERKRSQKSTATTVKVVVKQKVNVVVRGAKAKMKCHCGNVYEARTADLKRGWAQSCSKSCASIRREYGRSKATPVKE